MSSSSESPGLIWRLIRKLNQRMALNYQKGIGPGRLVLLLTTTGRRSGLPRLTPLQYEEVDGQYIVGSARGAAADWFRNIQANPHVQVQIKDRKFDATAEAVTDVERVADFLALRLRRHPLMIGLLMRLEGLPLGYTRLDLERFASRKVIIVIYPEIEPALPQVASPTTEIS